VCPPGKYKHRSGDDKCQTCPDHSMAPYSGSSECRCNQNYYRALKDPKSMPCTRKYFSLLMQSLSHVCAQAISTRIRPPIYIITRIPLFRFSFQNRLPSRKIWQSISLTSRRSSCRGINRTTWAVARTRFTASSAMLATLALPTIRLRYIFFSPLPRSFPHSIDSPLSPFFSFPTFIIIF
jgi:hypothetical protein